MSEGKEMQGNCYTHIEMVSLSEKQLTDPEQHADPAPVHRVVMRLFVWEGFCPDYTDGLAFAIAENIEEAQRLVIESKGYTPFDWGAVREFPVTEPRAYCVSGGG